VAAVAQPDGKVRSAVAESTVVFLRLPPAELERYLASGEWRDKAGGYALQGQAARFAHLVSGREDTVVGLPLDLVERLIADLHPSREKT
jgi:septum formation protein